MNYEKKKVQELRGRNQTTENDAPETNAKMKMKTLIFFAYLNSEKRDSEIIFF